MSKASPKDLIRADLGIVLALYKTKPMKCKSFFASAEFNSKVHF